MVLGGQPPGRVGRRRIFERPPRAGVRLSRLVRVELRDGDLELRPWREADVPALVNACNDPEIPRWIPVIPQPYTEADALAFVRGELSTAPEHSFAITQGGEVVGAIGLTVNQSRGASIGYWCAAGARNRGLVTRALRLIVRWGLEDLELARLALITDPDNIASQRVAEKVGFRREGVLRSHLLHPDGRLRDSVMFSLLPGELR
jgi:RimJ/RimL family protein N-acetyltransferase